MCNNNNTFTISISFSTFLILLLLFPVITISQPQQRIQITGGKWSLLHQSIGISAMHMQLLNTNQVVIFDRTDFGPSNLSLPLGHCRLDPNDIALQTDCTAHSLIYDVDSNTFRPLTVQTDTWCSSGSVLSNGTLVQTGGYNDGERNVRTLAPCSTTSSSSAEGHAANGTGEQLQCDWVEMPGYLSVRRWYASNQILPDGRVIIVGGRRAYNYEFYPIDQSEPSNFRLGFLRQTKDTIDENNLYPFLHLLPDGNLFIFANKRSILFDYVRHQVLREYPVIPGPDKRNYPSTGSSVLLPIRLSSGSDDGQILHAEVMVCGGAPPDAFLQAQQGTFLGASKSCGRLRVTDPEPVWVMEDMPMGRIMSDMLLLPTGDVIIINGAANGTAGWESAVNPVLYPVHYSTYETNPTQRFKVLNPSSIPRLYHSAAVLLADGRILVGGSNPHRQYNFTDVIYPTELSLEAFSPHYLNPEYTDFRPTIVSVGPTDTSIMYKQVLTVTFNVPMYMPENGISISMLLPSFTTHSFAMNQRLLVLDVVNIHRMSPGVYQLSAVAPQTPVVAPPGYYLLFLVHVGIPSPGVWLKME